MHWLAQGLRKVKFTCNQVLLWQYRILKETFLNLCKEREKNLTLFVSSCRLKEREKMSVTCSLFPLFEDPWPACLLPSHFVNFFS